MPASPFRHSQGVGHQDLHLFWCQPGRLGLNDGLRLAQTRGRRRRWPAPVCTDRTEEVQQGDDHASEPQRKPHDGAQHAVSSGFMSRAPFIPDLNPRAKLLGEQGLRTAHHKSIPAENPS